MVFWVSILVPRADGSLLGSDGTHYYAYLPSVILDGDLDFTNDYAVLLAGEPEKLEEYTSTLTPTGRPVNVWAIGPAILWAPFFLLAHLVVAALSAIGVGVQADGYGYPYQATVLTGSILYGTLGLWFVCRAVRRVVDDPRAVVAATLTVAAGGNLIYYMTVEPHMSHAPGVFASGLFFYTWLSRRGDASLQQAVRLGAIAGIMALIRPQTGLFLVLPLLDQLLLGRRNEGGEKPAVVSVISSAALSGVVALLVFTPQLYVWQRLWGTFLSSPYEMRGEEFSWLRPQLVEVLFSGQRGLFLWHPVFLFGVAGLVILLRRHRALAVTALFGIGLQIYLVASWWAWDQGKSFGGRMFIESTPIFVLGAAALWGFARDQGRERWALVLAGVLIFANLVFIPVYVLTW